MNLNIGDVLILERGEYNDYTYDGPFRVIKPFDRTEVAKQFGAEWQPELGQRDEYENPDPGDFSAWLAKNGYIENVYIEDLSGVVTWYVGAYSFDPQLDIAGVVRERGK